MDTVVYLNPFTGTVAQIPVQMIATYVPYASDLNLETAARVAAIRDQEEADNLILSMVVEDSIDGTGYDRLSVPFPY